NGSLRADLIEHLVDLRIDPAHEEGGDRCDRPDVTARRLPLAQPVDVGAGHVAVDVHAEHERDVDVDPLGDRRLDRRQALGRGRDLDEEVRPADASPEVTSTLQRRLLVGGEGGRDLDRYVAIGDSGRRGDVAADVGCSAYV